MLGKLEGLSVHTCSLLRIEMKKLLATDFAASAAVSEVREEATASEGDVTAVDVDGIEIGEHNYIIVDDAADKDGEAKIHGGSYSARHLIYSYLIFGSLSLHAFVAEQEVASTLFLVSSLCYYQ